MNSKIPIIVTLIILVSVVFLAWQYRLPITGSFLGWVQLQRLRQAGAEPDYINPLTQEETFEGIALSPVWAFDVINGAGKVGHLPQFHNTSVEMRDESLYIVQHPDPDFGHENPTALPMSEQYNNAALVGFQGFQPTPAEDVLVQCDMQASPNFYGSAGFVVQPLGTLTPDGLFKGRFGNGAFDLFGITLLGPESSVFGASGATVQLAANWWPIKAQTLPGVDITQSHSYRLRLRWLDRRNWLGVIHVDGQEMTRMTLPPFGPLEVQIWGDNYLLSTHHNVPDIRFQNGETKWIRFTDVAVWTEAR